MIEMKNLKANNIIVIKPVSYFDMLVLEQNADLIMTDSGGVQKKHTFLKKMCNIEKRDRMD